MCTSTYNISYTSTSKLRFVTAVKENDDSIFMQRCCIFSDQLQDAHHPH
jgi:hypothetical protein